MMKIESVCLLFTLCLSLAATSFNNHLSSNSPLFAAFEHFKEIIKDGCSIDVLPDNIDWCDGKLSQHRTLPDNTVCQSLSTEVIFLICRNGRWAPHVQDIDLPSTDRTERSISQVYETTKNITCSRFCVDDNTEFVGKEIPQFSFCPSSVTLYSSGNETDVQYTWDFPSVTDSDGTITSLVQIVGPESNSTFHSSSSPGINHVISYLATDSDNLNWTCSFVITSEIPTCPPMIHLTDGNTSCTDYNNRDSVCSFFCNHGYQLNGTFNATCLDNGTWSYEDDIPQCIAMTCSLPVMPMNDSTILEVVCDNTTDENVTFSDEFPFGSICWLQCPNDFLLKNDILASDILQRLSIAVNETLLAHDEALKASMDANDAADLALLHAEELQNSVTTAENNTNVIEGNLDEANSELEDALEQYNTTKIEMDLKLLQLENENEVPIIEALTKQINSLNTTLNDLNVTIEFLTLNISTLTMQLGIAQYIAESALANADQAWIHSGEADALALEKLALYEVAQEAYNLALAAYFAALTHSNVDDSIVSTYTLCTADGTWMIPGEPYCEDIHPPGIKCLPASTHYLNPGETSAVITWDLPEVTDNSGNYILNISGPQPYDTLSRGQYIAEYRAADSAGNLSPRCQIVINVLVNECEDVSSIIEDEFMVATCDNFEIGTSCNLSCTNSYQLDGPDTVTCKINTTSGTMYWDLDESFCIVETCAAPASPSNGYFECVDNDGYVDFDNTTDNNTDSYSKTCVAMCNETFMLPYKTRSDYNCDEDNDWDNDDFPTTCIDSGGEKHTEYKYQLEHDIQQNRSCDTYDLDGFMYNLAVIIASEMTSFPACMNGYLCEFGEMKGECGNVSKSVLVQFTILVTCDGPITSIPDDAKCDLQKDGAMSFASSLNESVYIDGVFNDLNITLGDDWLTKKTTVVPSCPFGAFLVGSYCARCAAGTFYDSTSDQCLQCGMGAHTHTDGRTDCTTCPPGTYTLQRGSTECTATCPAGSYSSSGLEPCLACARGTYQSESKSTMCITCPADTWTTGERSDNVADCVEYDLYFSGDVSDIVLTSINDSMSAVFWMKYYYPTHVGLEMFYDDGDSAFMLSVSDKPVLLYDSWDSEPIDVTMEIDTWIMFGITWDALINVVSVYKNGEKSQQISLKQSGLTDLLKLSVANRTLFSGLSISNISVSDAEMLSMHGDCGATLTSSVYTLDNLANIGHSAIDFTKSTCKYSTSDILSDPCGIHNCQHYSTCVPSNTSACYTCDCPEEYGGNFCEETLVHGNWSEWYYADECSASCGPGVRQIYRSCNNPSRSEYGNDCEGNSTDIVDCFLTNCTECERPEVEGVTICELEDEACVATCPAGYVLPRGQEKQTYQCGQSTSYSWAPLHRLPICTESRQPEKYTGSLTFNFVDPVPCDVKNEVKILLRDVALNQTCPNTLSACNVNVEILDCIAPVGRRKRQDVSLLVINYTVPLSSNVTFDLVEYYRTLNITDSIREAVEAIFAIEQTIQAILDDPGMFTVLVGSDTYTVIADSVIVSTTTHCYSGEVPVEGVCSQCQKGTFENNGWCVYCDRGLYQNLPGQSSCYVCPSNQLTDFVGARESIECIVIPQPPEPPTEPDYTLWIILAVCIFLALIILVIVIILSRRFYLSAKDREKFDMEADRISLYTDFPDMSYNVFYKRKQVLGFDEQGYPIVGNTRFQNGHIKQRHQQPDDSTSVDDGRMSVVSKEPFAYPEENQEPPFTYDPYAMWTEDAFIDPYEYPEMDSFDFPRIEHAVRYRVPGRKHMQNAYPLTQFGYTDRVYGNHRKNLQLPISIPIPKKLPQLMYRKPDTMSLKDILKSRFGFKKFKNDAEEEGIVINTKIPLMANDDDDDDLGPVPPLSLKKTVKKKSASSKGRKSFTPIRMTRSAAVRSPRTPKVMKAGSTMKAKIEARSPRAASAFSPRSISISSPSPRPSTSVQSSRSPRKDSEDFSHPKPSSYIVNKPTPNFVTIPEKMVMPTRMQVPPKPALRYPDEPRPDTGMTTGRKSVTIREDANITRPSTTATMFRPTTAGSSVFALNRPSTDAKSAMDTIVAPYAARPKSTISMISDRTLPIEVTDAYRPTSSIYRPMTPADFHPKPVLHADVTIKRTAGETLFFPPTNISFNQRAPVEHTMKQMQPPPFVNRVNPHANNRRQKRVRLNTGDNSNDPSESGSFFLTELPDDLRTSRASMLSKGSRFKKPSPPPDYSMSASDKIIETSSQIGE